MRALVVYESMYGNTRVVAERIRDGLAETWDVDLRSVDEQTPVDVSRYGLVVLGGPTHAFGMSTEQSRTEALRRVDDPRQVGPGIREWLPRIGVSYGGKLASFDTRTGRTPFTGSASRAMSRHLRREGYRLIARQSFAVKGQRGPLRDGELYRARTWGSELSVLARDTRGPRSVRRS